MGRRALAHLQAWVEDEEGEHVQVGSVPDTRARVALLHIVPLGAGNADELTSSEGVQETGREATG